jgi:hypothetical protein
MLYTDINIEVDNYGTKVISPGETVTFRIDPRDQSYSYEASTSGTTSSGALIGQTVYWQRTRDIDGDSYTTYLITEPDLFFLKMRNTGQHDLYPLRVNYGLADETEDQITIPGNGVLYDTGYYHAHSNTEVRATWLDMPTDYTYWQQGIHFSFPWTDNQSVTLLNTFKAGASGKESIQQYEVESHTVNPDSFEPFGFDAGVTR